jgi:hypothetical protein
MNKNIIHTLASVKGKRTTHSHEKISTRKHKFKYAIKE